MILLKIQFAGFIGGRILEILYYTPDPKQMRVNQTLSDNSRGYCMQNSFSGSKLEMKPILYHLLKIKNEFRINAQYAIFSPIVYGP